MRFHTVLLVLVLVLLVAFGILNYNALLFGHTLSLGFASYTGVPLGMILLVLGAILALLFYLLTSYANLRAQADSAKLLREMQILRQSLDSQEGSRFAQLQGYLEQRFGELKAQQTEGGNYGARVERVRDEIAADIGQLEDYLRRRLGDAPGSTEAPDPNISLIKPRLR